LDIDITKQQTPVVPIPGHKGNYNEKVY